VILWLQRRILTGLWRCAYFSYQFLEDMRPAGGFKNWYPLSYWKKPPDGWSVDQIEKFREQFRRHHA